MRDRLLPYWTYKLDYYLLLSENFVYLLTFSAQYTFRWGYWAGPIRCGRESWWRYFFPYFLTNWILTLYQRELLYFPQEDGTFNTNSVLFEKKNNKMDLTRWRWKRHKSSLLFFSTKDPLSDFWHIIFHTKNIIFNLVTNIACIMRKFSYGKHFVHCTCTSSWQL